MAAKSKGSKTAASKSGSSAKKTGAEPKKKAAAKSAVAGRVGKGGAAPKSVKPAKATAEKKSTKGARPAAKPQPSKKKETPKSAAKRAGAAPKKAAVPSRMKPKKAPEKPNYAEVADILRKMRVEILSEIAADSKATDVDVLSGDIYDQASTERDRELSLLLGERDRGKLLSINESLQRIKDGSYGECESCGEMIPLGRLKVLPFATLCIDCKAQAEQEAARDSFYGEGISAFGGLDGEAGGGGDE